MPFARLVQDKLKSGSGDQAGQAELKAMLGKEGMKLSPQAWLTLFDELDTNYDGKLEDLVDTLYTLYKDGEILVRWVGDKISHEPLPSTEEGGQDYFLTCMDLPPGCPPPFFATISPFPIVG